MFVDWLTVRQTHRQAPLWAESQLLSIDLETGELDWSTYRGKPAEGSFSSKLWIRSDGQTVEASGNPSRWNRADNLFGVRSVEAGLAVFNEVMRRHGLPEFYEDERTRLNARRLQRFDDLVRDGCVLTRVDVTENYSAGGKVKAEHALHALRSFRHQNRPPTDRGTTLSWGEGSRYTMMKYYLKAEELRAHRRRKSWSDYLQRLVEFCDAEGVVRFEVCCKSKFLRASGLTTPSAWTHDKMRAILEGYGLHERSETSVNSMHDIASALEKQGLNARRARHCQEAALAFLSGSNLRLGRSTATFYRLRKDLLRVGIDIAAELNVSALRFSIEKIELRPTQVPEWYEEAAG